MSKIETLKLLDGESDNVLALPEQILHAAHEASYLHSAGIGQVFPIVGEVLRGQIDSTVVAITFFDMMRLALQDLTVAQLLFKQANIEGIGQTFPGRGKSLRAFCYANHSANISRRSRRCCAT
ncbi:hypothetical protein [Pseudomonas fluorescens]|uniref:hypothetical protein n=1 Tax=Pseudomonas fluorescens TaxID=294 RepID=UPI001912C695|nr:hypothetical protein [Pseudomonas fluorescens]